MKKKVTALLLTLAMLVACIPGMTMTAFARVRVTPTIQRSIPDSMSDFHYGTIKRPDKDQVEKKQPVKKIVKKKAETIIKTKVKKKVKKYKKPFIAKVPKCNCGKKVARSKNTAKIKVIKPEIDDVVAIKKGARITFAKDTYLR